ncbi:hypothetical protein JD79_00204 [Geodermatophilus normandii]|uniref:ARB-07466-like C-terminal domain-containing protein n=1 Tax=Geodermatophilus normandii TaxID=1137989 RepID=A0A317QE09_9ACTN|nr:hypothetical protein [Geodermatophilus normandii]PWW21077.1 hypothetical protein JD79_00204 [Geodermatophilus normandii]
MRPIPLPRRRVLGTAVAAGLTTTLLLALPASAAAAGPTAPVAAPATVEEPAPYVGQAICDPGAKPGTVALAELLVDHYGTGSVGISRDCSVGGASEHKEGRALDWMLDAGDPAERAVAEDALAWLAGAGPDGEPAYAARRLGVMYVIWDREIWSPSRGWRPYRGASPHTDHVHVSLSWAGAMGATSWWTGVAVRVDTGPCTPDPGPGDLPPCAPGAEQPAPSTAAAAEPQEGSGVPDGDAEAGALAELAALREDSLARLETDGRWVAQLASKDVGITDPLQTAQNGTHVFQAVDVLAESRAALATVTDPAAVSVLHGTDFGRHSTAADGDPYWITVVDAGFGSRADVEDWCAATYPQLDGGELTNACVPRRLTPPHG